MLPVAPSDSEVVEALLYLYKVDMAPVHELVHLFLRSATRLVAVGHFRVVFGTVSIGGFVLHGLGADIVL